jgi:hypothetical protein
LELKPDEPAKPHSLAESAFDSVKKAADDHPQLEAAALASAGIAAGLLASRFHISAAVEHFFPKAASLLGGATEDLLQAHAASERLPKLLTKLHTAEPFKLLSRDIAAKPFAASLDRTAEVFAKPEFAKPVLTENAETVASIFAKHMDAPGWNALNRARVEAEKAADAAAEVLPKFPEGTPYTSNAGKLRELTLQHFGEDGLRKKESLDAAFAHRNALLAQSSAPDRLPILQNAFDEVTDKFSLPRVRVQFDEDLQGRGLYTLGTDQIAVKQSLLDGEELAQLSGTSAHELTHAEEGALLVRRMADKLGVGTTASEDQLKLLKEAHDTEVGVPVTDEFVLSVLKARNGRTLSLDENARAEKILHGILEDRDRMVENAKTGIELSKLIDLRFDLRAKPTWEVLSEYHGEKLAPESETELEGEDAIRQFIRLQNPEFDRVVRTLKVDETGKPMAWSDDADKAARRELREYLSTRTDVVRKMLDEYDKGYFVAFHEQEAHATTAAVRQAFEAQAQK